MSQAMTSLPFLPVDHQRVDLTEDFDLRYWTAEFACTPEQLITALQSVGVIAVDVGSYFADRRSVVPTH
jgi:hypothetical protein